jgi:Tol biopolymer transport system component/predicted Ser/Thr protein kinase
MIGKTLGHYQITEKLGEGGMGVVYKARDTHLDRFAALKVLPPERVSDPDRKRRFIQEAKAASALNHPNIITIHDIDQADGIDFIAMEYVAGKTLDELIPRKGMRLSLALKYAVQIADALARAHGAGIIHRDLKPSNVMVDEHGLVKVLDFGLAKLTEAAGPEAETAATRTGAGMILGTAAYMSPEQAEGKHIDTRSDIFSFGSMLYEMLTGQRAFRGDTRASTIASILREEPKPISQMAEGLPREVERIVRRCLRKDPEHRFQAMPDLKVALEELKEESDSGGLEAVVVTRPQPRRRLIWAICAVAAVVIAAVGVWLVRFRGGAPEVPMRAIPLVTYEGTVLLPTFSRDGNEVAFRWNGPAKDNWDIWRHQIGPGQPLRLTTDPAEDTMPAWSPDGRFIAFLRVLGPYKRAVYRIPALGGAEYRLGEINSGGYGDVGSGSLGIAWSPDGRWLAVTDRRGLFLLSVETGEKRSLTSPPKGSDIDPCFSPDGQCLAFVRHSDFNTSDIYRAFLDGDLKPEGEPERLSFESTQHARSPVWTRNGKDILYSSGLFFSAERTVRRIRDARRKSRSGYRISPQPFGEGAGYLTISPDGRRLAFDRTVNDSNIYRIELQGKHGFVGSPEKYISSTRSDYNPQYSPDGRTVAFESLRTGTQEIWLCNADESNPRQLTSMGGPQTSNPRWSPDGKTLVFDCRKEGSADLYLISVDGGSPRRLTSDPGYEGEAQWSRDGKWIYFYSSRTGRGEVYKMPSGGGEAIQVTKNGGRNAFESPDGKWLYYSKGVNNILTIWRVPLGGGEETQVHPGPLSYGYNFLVDDEDIYLEKTDGTLELFDVASGKSKTIIRIDRPWSLALTISPDHRWILFSQWDQVSSDLMLVENFR